MNPATLQVRFRKRVHDALALDVALTLGDACGVLFGPSGSGKTTTLRVIAGLAAADSGLIRLGSETLYDSGAGHNRPLRARRVGFVFQHDLLFPHLSAGGNIAYGLKGWPRAEARARLDEVAALCGVGHLLGRPPATLSGGERQRVGLARALAPRPRLLLCDEPVSALDLESRHALIERLRAAQGAEGVPVLYVTHSPAEAVALGSVLFRLEGGTIVETGPPLAVLAARGSASRLDGMRNTFRARVAGPGDDGSGTRLTLEGGPDLLVPTLDAPPGLAVGVEVRADDILVAVGSVEGLSARNALPGVVARVYRHGTEAEVLVATGDLTWVVSVTGRAVEALGLAPGVPARLVIKSRACHVRAE